MTVMLLCLHSQHTSPVQTDQQGIVSTPECQDSHNTQPSAMQGKSGITQIEKFDTDGYSTRFAGEIKELDVSKYVNRKMARRLDDVIKYTIVAGKKVRLVLPPPPHPAPLAHHT